MYTHHIYIYIYIFCYRSGHQRNYKCTRVSLITYKKHFKGIELEDSAVVANAIAKAKATFPKRLCEEQWPLICDLFEKPTWKVNIYS